ncbi:outer membrane protein assembly factor BamB family protein [Brevibacillus reuszeri]|uniref:outer membrane protein assembly factor BamB family protein n=1 Tax=Brevibacillus reuszeri TaxID=54915 RepID=UPI000CCC816B|nr:PQQ-binding-like beta-propeller repeat protein [Brevibacillus reuszeri]
MKRKPIQGWLASAVLVTSLWGGTPAFAESIGEEVKLNQSQPEISQAGFDIAEDYAVWINDGENTVTLYDLGKNTETKIGNKNSTKTSPRVDGDYVVWIDEDSAVTLYDISKGKETSISNTSGTILDVEIDDNHVVWSNKSGKGTDIYLYDIDSGEEEKVTTSGKAIRPTVSENYIAWEDSRDGNADIYYYDIDTQEETAAVTLRGNQLRPSVYSDTILYENEAGESTQIYEYDITTGKNKKITDGSADKSYVHIYKDKYVYVEDGDLRSAELGKSSARQIDSFIFKGNPPRTYGNYVLYAKRNSDKVLQLNLYDIKEKESVSLGSVVGEPSQPDGSDRYVVYLSESRRDDAVVLYDTKNKTSQIISKTNASPNHPVVSNRYVVWYDYSKKALISYDIQRGKETQITDTDEKQEPSDEIYKIDGSRLLWMNEGRRPELVITDLKTGTHESVATVKGEPLSIDIYGDYAAWVIEQSSRKATVTLYDINRGRGTDIVKNVQVEDAALGDNFVVWSEYKNNSWDLFSYNISRERTTELLRYTDRDQMNPQASRNMVFFKDNRLSPNAKDFYYELFDAEDGSFVDLSWSSKAEVTEPRIGGNRIVWIDTRDKAPAVYTMAISSPQDDDDDNGGPGPEPEPGDYKQYVLVDLMADGTYKEKMKSTTPDKFVFVFFANTKDQVKLSVEDAIDDLDRFIDLLTSDDLEDILIRIYE